MSLQQLFAQKPVLTTSEIHEYLEKDYSANTRSQESLLAYHVREGHLLRVRRGLYAVVPPGGHPDSCAVDPYLVAGKLAEDAVLAYHTALEFHGKAHSSFEQFTVQSRQAIRPTEFRKNRFECVAFPKALLKKRKEHFSTKLFNRSGVNVRVASLERTLVDLLDRPKHGGGWEEIWRSLETVEYFNVKEVVEYALLLGNATTAAKTGFFLEQHANTLMVDDSHLKPLRRRCPQNPHYLQRGKPGKLQKAWNLVVPEAILDRQWSEFA